MNESSRSEEDAEDGHENDSDASYSLESDSQQDNVVELVIEERGQQFAAELPLPPVAEAD